MGILDALNKDELARLASHTVKIGDVYEITMTEANGIKPKAGHTSRDCSWVRFQRGSLWRSYYQFSDQQEPSCTS